MQPQRELKSTIHLLLGLGVLGVLCGSYLSRIGLFRRFEILRLASLLAVLGIAFCVCTPAFARTQLKNICRIKGQEENVLRGLGVVVGLNGTGEANDGPTMMAIARAMEVMGNPLAMNGQQAGLEELRKMK